VTSRDDDSGNSEDDSDDSNDQGSDENSDHEAAAPVKLAAKASPYAEEEAALAKAKEALKANLEEQKTLQEQLRHLSNPGESNREIDAQVKLVGHETESAALGGTLGRMWKEMRMFELPFFAQHVEEEMHLLKQEEQRLEREVADAEARLADAKKRDEAQQVVVKDTAAESKVSDAEADAEAQVPITDVSDSNRRGSEYDQLGKWSYWHMNAKQRENLLAGSAVYFLFGILFAFIYQKIRSSNGAMLDPKTQMIVGEARAGKKRDFSAHLCGCLSDINVCLCAFCCFHCRWADTVSKKGLFKYWPAFLTMLILALLHPYTLGFTEIIMLVVGTVYRQRLRVKYNIQSGGSKLVQDCCIWCWCAPCAVVQEAREEFFVADDRPQICSSCGNEFKADSHYCRKCGKKREES
jgi:Cys-rich protein (TIGR01571 family)